MDRRYFSSLYSRIPNQGLSAYFLAFFIAIVILAYFIPIVLYPMPWGSDVYFHMDNTERMYQSNSLVVFYEKSFQEEYLGYDYPFGMWYFGSIVMKMTGMTIQQLVVIFPFVLVLMAFFIFYIFALTMLKKTDCALLSLIFLISMPFLALNLLNYSTSRFVSIFLVMFLYITVREKQRWQDYLLVIAIIFTLVVTHTGTYMFLIFFTTAYFLFYALIWKKFDWWMFSITAITIFVYVFAVQEFQFVQPQYIDKGRLVISLSDSIASASGLDVIRDMGTIFYDNIFVSNNLSYAIFWSALIFTAGILALWVHRKLENRISTFKLTLPFIGDITNVSHGIISTPFWIGPAQTILSVFGIFRLDSKGKCIFLALFISTIFPGAMQTGEGTGSLRETYYLFLIIPVTAAAGLAYIYPKIKKFADSPRKKAIVTIIFVVIFAPLIAAPIVGSLHYMPQISGSLNEKENLIWLSTIGKSFEGVSGFAYRERIDIYSQKNTPSIPSGSETKRFTNDLQRTYFGLGSERETEDLYSFNIQYLISSERILQGFDMKPDALRIDTNTRLDKIFVSNNQFGIYSYNNQTGTPLPGTGKITDIHDNIVFDEHPGGIRDFGSSYLFEDNYYKIRLDKRSPAVQYLGTNTKNMLGEGFFIDDLTVYSRSEENSTPFSTTFEEITYDSIANNGDILQYKGTITRPEGTSLASILVTYHFYEKCVKRDIRIANDKNDLNKPSDLNVYLSESFFTPLSDFDFTDMNEEGIKETTRKIYPSQDMIPLKDIKTNRVFLNDKEEGILIKYMNTAPYPDRLLYKGSTVYDYGNIIIGSQDTVAPGDAYDVEQYFAVGEKDEAIRKIEEYTSTSLYDYPDGMIPLVILDPYPLNNPGWAGRTNYTIPGSELVNYTASTFTGMKQYQTQHDELAQLVGGRPLTGIILPNLLYNLDTIRALSELSIPGIVGTPVNPPLSGLYNEGKRNLKEAQYNGEPTGVVIIPVSFPPSTLLGRGYSQLDVFAGWTGTLDSVVNEGGIAVFYWSPDDFASSGLQDEMNSLLDYAEIKGMTLTPLDPLIRHTLLLQNITLGVDPGMDSVTIKVQNNNYVNVTGVTCKVILPGIDGSCPYAASGDGKIVRIDKEDSKCVVYVAFDLAAGESKNSTIEPTMPRKRFGIDFSNLYHGTNLMVILDDEGNAVPGALVKVDTRSYTSDEAGEVRFYVRSGDHTISVEKPGFKSRQVNIYIKSKISRYLDYLFPR